MDISISAFTYIISLAAVINGLGIVHLLRGFSEYLSAKDHVTITHYWVFNLWIALQFLLHILLWWSMWGVREAGPINFLTYLYLLAGPIILYLGTSLLVPEPEGGEFNLNSQYQTIRRPYFTIITLFWLWALFMWPLIAGVIPPTAPVFAINLVIALTLRITANHKVHAVLTIATYLVIALFIAFFAMQLGGVSEALLAK